MWQLTSCLCSLALSLASRFCSASILTEKRSSKLRQVSLLNTITSNSIRDMASLTWENAGQVIYQSFNTIDDCLIKGTLGTQDTQLLDGHCSYGWQILATHDPPHRRQKNQHSSHWNNSGKRERQGRRRVLALKKMLTLKKNANS